MSESEPERVRTYGPDGEPYDEVLRTASGKVLTEQEIQRLADEAEAGYDVDRITTTDVGMRRGYSNERNPDNPVR